jgi:hypothetical protein
VFYRHEVGDPPDRREVVHKDGGPAIQGIFFPLEHWSPDGVFVAYKLPGRGFALLNADSGTVRSFDTPPAADLQAAWKADSSVVVCASFDEKHSPNAAVLIELDTGQTTDLSREFSMSFADPFRSSLEPAWTPEGKYFIVNTSEQGGSLVQPRPWVVIPVGELVADTLGRRHPADLYSDPSANPLPSVHFFPAAGWVQVLAGGREYAVDYAVGQSVRLGGGIHYSPYPEVVAVDRGKRTVEVAPLGGIKVRRVDLNSANPLERSHEK